MKLAQLALALVALPAVAEPQFVTLERASRESLVGVQGSLQFYPDSDGIKGLRTELFGQFTGDLRGGGAIGGYGHLALGFLFTDGDDESAISNLELGGYYVTGLGAQSNLTLHLGLSLPTASDGFGETVTNVLTHLERNYDLINADPETTALKLGATLRAPLGVSGFLQGDLALDVPLDAPGEDNDPIFHANVGLGAYVGSAALIGEVALAFAEGDMIGSLGLGIRFMSSVKPHVGYLMAFADDDSGIGGDGGIIAHMITFGFYTDIR
jgi:hypothetical protein